MHCSALSNKRVFEGLPEDVAKAEWEERIIIMLKKIAIQYITGCIFGAAGFICFLFATASIEKLLFTEIFFGGDKSVVFSGLFLGIPIGSLVGLSTIDRLVFRAKRLNKLGLIVGFVISWFGIVFGLYLMDIVGSKIGVLLGLLETNCLTLIGYNIKSLFKKRKKNHL